jgi:hypothetical protein
MANLRLDSLVAAHAREASGIAEAERFNVDPVPLWVTPCRARPVTSAPTDTRDRQGTTPVSLSAITLASRQDWFVGGELYRPDPGLRSVSLRKVSAGLAERGFVTPGGRPYSASAVASMPGRALPKTQFRPRAAALSAILRRSRAAASANIPLP